MFTFLASLINLVAQLISAASSLAVLALLAVVVYGTYDRLTGKDQTKR